MDKFMEEVKVTISTVEETCTVFVVGEDVKEESKEYQGIVKYFIYVKDRFF